MLYNVFITSSGSPIEQGSVSGVGTPRLFYQSALYVYGLAGSLHESKDFGLTFADIAPAGVGSVIAMCQPTKGSDSITTIFAYLGAGTYATKYQKFPETVIDWSVGASTGSGFSAADAIAGDFTSVPLALPVIVANGLTTSYRVQRSDAEAPFAFVQSDAGLTTAIPITDLDAVY